MPTVVSNIFSNVGSHLIVALLTALITVSFALGSYKQKIDILYQDKVHIEASFVSLSGDLNALRNEVSKLRIEMEYSRAQNK